MSFSQIIGNESARAMLLRMVEHKTVPHALLFCGPAGVGKGAHALEVAKCLMGPSSIHKLCSGNHPDLHVLYPEGKAGLHPVESIRTLLKEATLPPFEAPVKVFIIHDAHHMLPASSHALLKTLEEPIAHTYFILISDQPESILQTIVSRSRKIAFFLIPEKDIACFAQEKWHKDPHEAQRLAFLAHGSFAKASRLAHQSEEKNQSLIHSLVSLSFPQGYARLLFLCEEFEKNTTSNEDKPHAEGTIDDLLEKIFAWFRDLHLLKNRIAPEHLYHLDAVQVLQEQAQGEIPSLECVLNELLKFRFALQRHVKIRVALEHFFLSIAQKNL